MFIIVPLAMLFGGCIDEPLKDTEDTSPVEDSDSSTETADETGDTDTDETGDTDTVETGDTDTDEAAFITEAFDCTPNTQPLGVAAGTDLLKVTLSDADAICNDGSPAVMYVRKAATLNAAENWVFHLQGGGGCGGTDCANRWCERNEKMTSTKTPDGMMQKGILYRGEHPAFGVFNQLGDANQVYLYYCSSDNWAGTQIDVTVEADDDVPAFRTHFQGTAIIDAALAALEAGVTTDDGSIEMPPLAAGASALWTGTSGGCQGVLNTGDRVAEHLDSIGVNTWLVCDANFSPTTLDLPAGPALESYVESRKARFAKTSMYAQPLLDQSCLAFHSEEDAYLCEWPGYVASNHIASAPLFVRMSLADSTISNGYLDAGFSIEEFASGVRSLMLRASSTPGNEPPPRPIAVYGPGCTQHVGITSDEWFLHTTIMVNETPVSVHDALLGWINGMDVVAVDTVPPSLSFCGETTEDTH